MKRICSWCEKEMGWTCPQCSSTKISFQQAGHFDMAECADCGYVFPAHGAGQTHGMCDGCRAEFKKKNHGVISPAGDRP
jgi:rubredoxin